MMKKTTNIIGMCLAVLAFSGCGLYQKYERPEVETAGLIRDAASLSDTLSASGEDSFGNVAWQDVFTDPQLQALIQQGLEKNKDLLNAALNVKMAEAQLSTARLAFIPSFAFAPQAGVSSVLSGDYKTKEWSRTYSLPVAASWNADLFGNLVAQNRSAKVALIASQDYQQAVRSRIICGIANCYYTLLMLDRQQELVADMEKLTKDTWDMMKLQKELRGAKETAVVSAEASYLKVKAQAIDLQRQTREVENALSLLIGQQAQTIQRGKLADQRLPEDFSAGVGIELLSDRPDVHAAEMSLAQCFYGVESARSRFFPGLNITGTGVFTNSLGSMVANPGQFLANFAASLTQPLFQNGKIVAGLKVAKAQYEQAYNNWQHSILAAGAEVSDALVQYNSCKAKAEIDRQQVAALEKSVGYTQDLFKMGSSSYLEVISAQANLLNAEISVVTDDFNKMQAVVNLYSALGGGRK